MGISIKTKQKKTKNEDYHGDLNKIFFSVMESPIAESNPDMGLSSR